MVGKRKLRSKKKEESDTNTKIKKNEKKIPVYSSQKDPINDYTDVDKIYNFKSSKNPRKRLRPKKQNGPGPVPAKQVIKAPEAASEENNNDNHKITVVVDVHKENFSDNGRVNMNPTSRINSSLVNAVPTAYEVKAISILVRRPNIEKLSRTNANLKNKYVQILEENSQQSGKIGNISSADKPISDSSLELPKTFEMPYKSANSAENGCRSTITHSSSVEKQSTGSDCFSNSFAATFDKMIDDKENSPMKLEKTPKLSPRKDFSKVSRRLEHKLEEVKSEISELEKKSRHKPPKLKQIHLNIIQDKPVNSKSDNDFFEESETVITDEKKSGKNLSDKVDIYEKKQISTEITNVSKEDNDMQTETDEISSKNFKDNFSFEPNKNENFIEEFETASIDKEEKSSQNLSDKVDINYIIGFLDDSIKKDEVTLDRTDKNEDDPDDRKQVATTEVPVNYTIMFISNEVENKQQETDEVSSKQLLSSSKDFDDKIDLKSNKNDGFVKNFETVTTDEEKKSGENLSDNVAINYVIGFVDTMKEDSNALIKADISDDDKVQDLATEISVENTLIIVLEADENMQKETDEVSSEQFHSSPKDFEENPSDKEEILVKETIAPEENEDKQKDADKVFPEQLHSSSKDFKDDLSDKEKVLTTKFPAKKAIASKKDDDKQKEADEVSPKQFHLSSKDLEEDPNDEVQVVAKEIPVKDTVMVTLNEDADKQVETDEVLSEGLHSPLMDCEDDDLELHKNDGVVEFASSLNLEPVHFKEEPKFSYKRKREKCVKTWKEINMAISDDEEKVPPKKRKKRKVNQKHQQQLKKWAKNENKNRKEIEKYDLCVE